MKVVWSPLAEQRALEAVEYIAQDRPRFGLNDCWSV
jgi:plasmid stabilization system protein ParE